MMTRISAVLLAAVALYFQGCSTTTDCGCCGGDSSTSTKQLKYAVVPGFFDANPGGQSIGPCHGGVVTDRSGNIYVSTDTPRGILVYSSKGKFLRAIGPTKIHGLQISREDGIEYIYAARPSEHEVLKLKMDGSAVWAI